MSVDENVVLREVTGILDRLRAEFDLDDSVEITRETTFQADLELESIDLVELAALLNERYGEDVNFAEFLADMELEEIIELTVGQLVDYVVTCLRAQDEAVAGVELEG